MKARNLFYVLLIVLVLSMVFAGYGFWWARTQLLGRQSEVVKVQLETVDEQKRTEQLLQLGRRYSQAKTKLDDINRALPRESQQAEILLSIRNAAEESGVVLPSIQFTGAAQLANPKINQATPIKGLYVVPVSLKFNCSYVQLLTFLDTLERLSRYNSVGSLNLTKTATNPDLLEVSLTLNAYLKP
ncbi:MAG: type 4a pilus biogenesis protein PilO [bacterium]